MAKTGASHRAAAAPATAPRKTMRAPITELKQPAARANGPTHSAPHQWGPRGPLVAQRLLLV
eukprot:151192-Pyramimonas_sp.AAC.1